MRKRLGSLEKSPIEKLSHGAQRGAFALFASVVALILTHFGIDFGVDFLNFLEENTDGNDYILHSSPIVWYTKGFVALVALFFIIKRQ